MTTELRYIRLPDLIAEIEYIDYAIAEALKEGDAERLRYLEYRGKMAQDEFERRKALQEYLPRLRASANHNKASLPLAFIKRVKETVDITKLFLDILNVPLIAVGAYGRYSYLCPIHHDTHPSGKIYGEMQRWWCFGCVQGGDCFDALMAFRGMDFADAVRELARWQGIELPRKKKGLDI